jgi:hypothetical protein
LKLQVPTLQWHREVSAKLLSNTIAAIEKTLQKHEKSLKNTKNIKKT